MSTYLWTRGLNSKAVEWKVVADVGVQRGHVGIPQVAWVDRVRALCIGGDPGRETPIDGRRNSVSISAGKDWNLRGRGEMLWKGQCKSEWAGLWGLRKLVGL
jgi:hypothetical protein